MARVRQLTIILLWVGWASLGLSVLGAVASLLSLPSQQAGYASLPPGSFIVQPTLMTIASSLLMVLWFPLIPFLGWGLLTVLCEIETQLREQVGLMRE